MRLLKRRYKRWTERVYRLNQIAWGSGVEDEDRSLARMLADQGIETEEDIEEIQNQNLTKLEKGALEKAEKEMRRAFGADYEQVDELSHIGVEFAQEEYPDLLESLETPGPDGRALGNNPEVVKVFYRLGKLIKKAKEGE